MAGVRLHRRCHGGPARSRGGRSLAGPIGDNRLDRIVREPDPPGRPGLPQRRHQDRADQSPDSQRGISRLQPARSARHVTGGACGVRDRRGIQRVGSTLRISVQLTDASGAVQWARSFDGSLDGALFLEDRLAAETVAAIQARRPASARPTGYPRLPWTAHVDKSSQTVPPRPVTNSRPAFDAYLRARHLFENRDLNSATEAAACTSSRPSTTTRRLPTHTRRSLMCRACSWTITRGRTRTC